MDGDSFPDSAISNVTVAPPEVLGKTMRAFGWFPGRRVDVVRDCRRLTSAGYHVPPHLVDLLKEFVGLPIRVSKLHQFAYFEKWPQKGRPNARLRSERIRITGRLGSCTRTRSDEARIVEEVFRRFVHVEVVRVGIARRNTATGGVEHYGARGKNVLFADYTGRIYELEEFHSAPFVSTYRSMGDFLALKCLSFDQLFHDKISKAVEQIPVDECDTPEMEREFTRMASMLGVV